jgi:hypothetical protein
LILSPHESAPRIRQFPSSFNVDLQSFGDFP